MWRRGSVSTILVAALVPVFGCFEEVPSNPGRDTDPMEGSS
jgi:hypothetical protein